MHFESVLGPEDRAFLAEVRAFIAEELDPALVAEEDLLRTQVADHERSDAWCDKLRPRRWHVATWPREHGGAGLTAMQNYLLLYEAGLAGAPLPSPLGLSYVGPVTLHFGSEEQKAEVLPVSPTAACTGARDSPNRVRARTSAACRPSPSATVTATSLTARKSGPPWLNMPIIACCWHALIIQAHPRQA